MIYAFGEYELDLQVYELRCAGRVHPIEPQVFDVLAYLVRHRDRLISKEELLETLWPDRFVSETTLTSRLKEARKAVGDSGSRQSVIRTQRGRGYRFVAEVEEKGEEKETKQAPSAQPSTEDAAGHEASGNLAALFGDFLSSGLERSTAFVGRRVEMDHLVAALRSMIGGERRVLFITGEAGAGKTTLVETFIDLLPSDSGVLVARGQCLEHRGSGEPYMPLLDAFSRLAKGVSSELVVSILRGLAPSWLVQMPSLVSAEELDLLASRAGAGERMLREIGLMIERLTNQRPLILVLEDLHWSDYATLDAIDLIAKQAEPARLLVIGTWRPSDVKAARHPVYALTQELRARRKCEIVALPPLGAEDLESYLSDRFEGAAIVASLVPILEARTAGNALFVRNVVESWIERGLIRRDDGMWQLGATTATLERDVPDTLVHLIENQISELDPGQQRILEAASIVGRSFPAALLAAALPAAEDDVEVECERLVHETSMLQRAGDEHWGDGSLTSRFAFAHDLYADVLYQRIPTARRARLHGQIGHALELAWEGMERQRAPELARHYRQARDFERGPRYLQLAADLAIGRNAYREAIELVTSALELLDGAPPSEIRDRAELQLRCKLAPALTATRGWTDSGAEENYLRSRELAESLDDHALLSQTLYGMANMYEFSGRFDLAQKTTNERIALDGTGTGERVLESHELLTCSFLHQGLYKTSVQHGEKALAGFAHMVAKDLDPEILGLVVQAYGWMSGSLHFAGRTDEALAHNARALELSAEGGNEFARSSALIQSAFVRFYRREPEECGRLIEQGGAIAREFRFPFHVACARVLGGWAAAVVGESSTEVAVREIRAGIRTSESIGARMDLPLFHAILATVLAEAEERDQAIEAIDVGIRTADRGRTFFYLPELHRQRGEMIGRDAAKRDDAIEWLKQAFELSEEQQCPLFQLRAARDLVRMQAGEEWETRLAAVYRSFEQGRETVDLVEVGKMLNPG